MSDSDYIPQHDRPDPSKHRIGRTERAWIRHALVADDMIRELTSRLHTRTHVADALECDCIPCVEDRRVLARVERVMLMGGTA